VGVKALFERTKVFKHVVIYAGDDGQDKDAILAHVKVTRIPGWSINFMHSNILVTAGSLRNQVQYGTSRSHPRCEDQVAVAT
jgi:hypothetical protein